MLREDETRERLLLWLSRSEEARKCSPEALKAIEDRLKAFVPVPSAIAYMRDGKVYLHTWAQVWDGLKYLSGDVAVMEPGDETGLGRKVLETLGGFRFVEQMPEKLTGMTKPLQKAAGVRSEKAFFEVPHKRLQIEFRQGRLVFTPHREVGKAYELQEEKAGSSVLEPEEIGRTLLRTLEAAEWSH